MNSERAVDFAVFRYFARGRDAKYCYQQPRTVVLVQAQYVIPKSDVFRVT